MHTSLQEQSLPIFHPITVTIAILDEYFHGFVEQLASEPACALPEGLAQSPLPEIDPDEFEHLYSWFLA
jgi:hypothetical protein